MSAKRVLVVADDEFMADAIEQAFSNAGCIVQASPTTVPVDRLIVERSAHMVVMDAGDNVADRTSTIERFRAASDVPLVLLTSSHRVEDRLDGLEAGADDVITKPFSLVELVCRARAILRRCGQREGRVTLGDVIVDEPAHTVERNGVPIDLTATEFSLLTMLCRHRGMVLSKNQLLSKVWGFEHYDVNLVEVHVSALRRKLEEHGPRILHTIRGVGYVMRPVETAAQPDVRLATATPLARMAG